MTKQTRIAMLKNRVKLLQARTNKDNGNVIKAIQREIKTLEGEP